MTNAPSPCSPQSSRSAEPVSVAMLVESPEKREEKKKKSAPDEMLFKLQHSIACSQNTSRIHTETERQ